jgi:putative salt-induced outer membrane protein YdiY
MPMPIGTNPAPSAPHPYGSFHNPHRINHLRTANLRTAARSICNGYDAPRSPINILSFNRNITQAARPSVILGCRPTTRESAMLHHHRSARSALSDLPWIALLITSLLTAARPLQADQITLTDGSRIVGTIDRLAASTLVITTRFAGPLTVDTSQLQGLSSDRPLIITLTDGRTLTGQPLYSPDAGQTILSTTGSTLTITPADIHIITPVPQPSATTTATTPPSPETAPAPAPLPPAQAGATAPTLQTPPLSEADAQTAAEVEQIMKIRADADEKIANILTPPPPAPPKLWALRLELGLAGDTGNNERFAIRGRAQADRTTEINRLKTFIAGDYAEDDGRRSANEITAGTDYEHDIAARTFLFLSAQVEQDEFEDLDLRVVGTGGIGYFLIKQELQELKTRIGLGYETNEYSDNTSDEFVVAQAGYEYRLDLSQWLRFTHSLTYYPSVEDPASDYRFEMLTAAEIPIGAADSNWRLRTGMKNNFDADPQPGIERLDTSYFLNLVYNWR